MNKLLIFLLILVANNISAAEGEIRGNIGLARGSANVGGVETTGSGLGLGLDYMFDLGDYEGFSIGGFYNNQSVFFEYLILYIPVRYTIDITDIGVKAEYDFNENLYANIGIGATAITATAEVMSYSISYSDSAIGITHISLGHDWNDHQGVALRLLNSTWVGTNSNFSGFYTIAYVHRF